MQKQDFSHEVNFHSSTSLRVLLVLVGITCVALGVIGIFLPVLPTTPFMLLAAACFARSSRRFYNWIMNNRIFGPLIQNWRKYRSIPRRAKWTAIFLMLSTFGASIIFFVPYFYLKIALAILCISMVIFMWRIPERELTESQSL